MKVLSLVTCGTYICSSDSISNIRPPKTELWGFIHRLCKVCITSRNYLQVLDDLLDVGVKASDVTNQRIDMLCGSYKHITSHQSY